MKEINRFNSKADFEKFEKADPSRGILIEDVLETDSFLYVSPQALGVVGSTMDVNVLLCCLLEHLIESNVDLDFFYKHFRKELVNYESKNYGAKHSKVRDW